MLSEYKFRKLDDFSDDELKNIIKQVIANRANPKHRYHALKHVKSAVGYELVGFYGLNANEISKEDNERIDNLFKELQLPLQGECRI